ncbi:hypothetical protein K8T06_10845, partial [bacterium]|nr:hypothetical protein [bacterium]
SWFFPVLLGMGMVLLPSANWGGRVGIIIGMLVVFTGWSSFGLVQERLYNDLLLFIDLSLMVIYGLILIYSSDLYPWPEPISGTLWNLSGTVFFLYALWDIVVYSARDTRAIATKQHLIKFAYITFIIAVVFFTFGGVTHWHNNLIAGESIHMLELLLTPLWIGIWLSILAYWHIGRLRAAIRDSKSLD